MTSVGPDSTHLLVELIDADPVTLQDASAVEAILREAAAACGATVVAVKLHRFRPQGVAGVLVLEESHISLHTWPERGYAAADVFMCGRCEPHRAVEILRVGMKADRCEVLDVRRGQLDDGPSIRVVEQGPWR